MAVLMWQYASQICTCTHLSIYLSIYLYIYIYTWSISFGLIRNLKRSQTRKVRRIASAYGRDSPIKIHGCWWLNLMTPRISDGDSHKWWSIRKTIWLSFKMMIFCRVNHANPTFIMVGLTLPGIPWVRLPGSLDCEMSSGLKSFGVPAQRIFDTLSSRGNLAVLMFILFSGI